MICRMWRGWTTAQNASPYERYLNEELCPRIQADLAAHGYRGHQLLRADRQDEVEFVVLTWFDSLESIKSFAIGPDPEVAVISAKAAGLLLRHEPRALHFHRASETLSRTGSTLSSDNTTHNREMFQQFDRKMVECADMTISCVIGGDGPPVLLLHGFPQNLAMWARVAPALARKFTVVCADLRGYGDSGKPRCAPDRSNYSFRAMAGDQVGLMRKLGFERFHVTGHDRGGRAAHRMALDWPQVVASLAVLDIVPTHTMFMQTNRHVAGAYWHWYFLSQPESFPERLIGADPDFFYEACLVGWGATRIEDFDPQQLADYRRCWRDPAMIHGSCSDYRAAATIDLEHDSADIERQVACPTLALWGSNGLMHRHFNIGDAWRQRCTDVRAESLPGGHFFVDQLPEETARVLTSFLDGRST